MSTSSSNTDGLSGGKPLQGLVAGQKVFSRYELIRILGQGGMGVVWLAKDLELAREVALKFLPDIINYNPGAIEDLKRETRRSLELTHPHIIRIYDFRQEQPLAAISMEYVAGETLAARRSQSGPGCFSVAEITPWVRQMGEALIYAHEQAQVIHRDLKPANIMLTAGGQVKLADFGISQSLMVTATQVHKGVVQGSSGTLSYMSPQQLLGGEAQASHDIYSLGATLYELLAGRPPFYNGDVSKQICEVEPPALNQRRGKYAPELEPIAVEWEAAIMACLAKQPEGRPASVREFLARVGLVPGAASVAVPVTVAGTTERSGVPRWLPIAAGLALIIGLGWFFGVHQPAETKAAADAASAAAANAQGALAVRQKAEADAKQLELEAKLKAEQQARMEPAAQSEPARATRYSPWVNSLGMKFIPVPATDVLFCVWHTRVQDFEAFVKATGHNATKGMYSTGSGAYKQRGDSWKSPGFTQTGQHPVCGVSWEDARAFGQWLTEKERGEGKLTDAQSYRLPQDWEWSVAVGLNEARAGSPEDKAGKIKGVYPWGTQWPPPNGAGNYAGEGDQLPFIEGFKDGFPRTSPVSSFNANKYGLFDMGGNLWQWCEDYFDGQSGSRALRGGSWSSIAPDKMLSSYRDDVQPGDRNHYVGFRLVMVLGVRP